MLLFVHCLVQSPQRGGDRLPKFSEDIDTERYLKMDYDSHYKSLLLRLTEKWDKIEAESFLKDHPPVNRENIYLALYL